MIVTYQILWNVLPSYRILSVGFVSWEWDFINFISKVVKFFTCLPSKPNHLSIYNLSLICILKADDLKNMKRATDRIKLYFTNTKTNLLPFIVG